MAHEVLSNRSTTSPTLMHSTNASIQRGQHDFRKAVRKGGGMKFGRAAIVFFVTLLALAGQQVRTTLSGGHPAKVAIMLDQTTSTLSNRVQMPSMAEFEPLLHFLADSGGELGVGVIRERSNTSLIRCRLEERPVTHTVPPHLSGNVFLRQKMEKAYKDAQAIFDASVVDWSNENKRRLELFRRELMTIIARPINATATDINGAIRRADLFLAEPDEAWSQPARRFAVFVTDGLDNVRAPAAAVHSNTKIVMVNGSANLGTLAALHPIRIESFSAAVQYIVHQQNKEHQ